ncbi:hypothetical protein QQY24_21500 [Streptomyces sp. TG1A-8]|uniref:hypothetical protein n=1 Tax=Streptomyces sp. TG1A-8 TaxID=3051385 RepID=UPI00265C82DA|nr:hypothetical protein [Streptomyces sp. TG1A-8]MDO0927857.1 hypothetical protein [Streptomyces sp. TG1A-8]
MAEVADPERDICRVVVNGFPHARAAAELQPDGPVRVTMVCYAACVRRTGAREASILFALIPAAAVVAARFLQGTSIDITTAVALTCGALACIAQTRSARATPRLPRCERSLRGGVNVDPAPR